MMTESSLRAYCETPKSSKILGRHWYIRTKWGGDGQEGQANEPITSWWKLFWLLLLGERAPVTASTYQLRCDLDRVLDDHEHLLRKVERDMQAREEMKAREKRTETKPIEVPAKEGK